MLDMGKVGKPIEDTNLTDSTPFATMDCKEQSLVVVVEDYDDYHYHLDPHRKDDLHCCCQNCFLISCLIFDFPFVSTDFVCVPSLTW